MTIELELVPSGGAHVVTTDGDHIVLQCSRAFPPGAPLRAQLVGGPGVLEVKVRGSKRDAEDPRPFRVEGRTMNLKREQRAFLLGSLDAAQS